MSRPLVVHHGDDPAHVARASAPTNDSPDRTKRAGATAGTNDGRRAKRPTAETESAHGIGPFPMNIGARAENTYRSLIRVSRLIVGLSEPMEEKDGVLGSEMPTQDAAESPLAQDPALQTEPVQAVDEQTHRADRDHRPGRGDPRAPRRWSTPAGSAPSPRDFELLVEAKASW